MIISIWDDDHQYLRWLALVVYSSVIGTQSGQCIEMAKARIKMGRGEEPEISQRFYKNFDQLFYQTLRPFISFLKLFVNPYQRWKQRMIKTSHLFVWSKFPFDKWPTLLKLPSCDVARIVKYAGYSLTPTHLTVWLGLDQFLWSQSGKYAQVICFGHFIQIVFPLRGGWTSIWARGT